jgi:maltose O-acetyltransferase
MNIVSGRPIVAQPTLFCGKGKIIFGDKVHLGYRSSPFFYAGYLYIEARTPDAVIEIRDGTYINNNCVLISEGAGIEIGSKCLIGPEVNIFDSDFHGLIDRKQPLKSAVRIGNNVFIGARATILKGVQIGNNSVIAAGAVVTKDVPPNNVAAGNPAQVVKVLR